MLLFAPVASSATGGTALPRISVITVVWNGARTLGDCIGSLAKQQYGNLEYLIIDGGSTDGTLEIVRAFPQTVTGSLSEPDGGTYDAMNKGVRMATGDFVLFLGADDQLLADLREVAPHLRDPCTIYYGDAFWPARNRRYDGPFGAAKLALRNICQQTMFYPRAVFEKYAFDTRYRLQADWEFNMRCFSDPELRFEYLPLLVSRYNDLDGSSTRHRDLDLEGDYVRLLWRHFPGRVALPVSIVVLGGRVLRRIGLLRGGVE
jgi:glycosyltransferase involved in cell wall biosynthesis